MDFNFEILWRNIIYLLEAAVGIPLFLGIAARAFFYRADSDSMSRPTVRKEEHGPEPQFSHEPWPGPLGQVEILSAETGSSDSDHTGGQDAGASPLAPA